MTQLPEQLREMLEAAEVHGESGGLARGQTALQEADDLRLWIHYFETHHPCLCARELLSGARAAILETVVYITIGFGRGAINSMRLQIDLLLGFTYFCEHPREWARV